MQDLDELEALGRFWLQMKVTEEADIDFLLSQLCLPRDDKVWREAVRSYRKQMLQVGHSEGWVAAR